MRVVTRFAPSPTGALHIGGVRTAVFSWLFARQHAGGRFLLRIEDTDRERCSEAALASILEGLNWLGLNWDGPVLFQSQRGELYRAYLKRLLDQKSVYFCRCSPARLEGLRERQLAAGELPKYDGHCRDLNLSGDLEDGLLRFRSPREGQSCFVDKIRGPIQVEASALEDWVVWRRRSPIYNFCVVVDDIESSVTHVIRGDDHISNTHRQLSLLGALGLPPPTYAHLPLVMDSQGCKLSKRTGAKSLLEYAEMGFLPEALLNSIARCGASFGEEGQLEILSPEALVRHFRLDRVSKSPACLNPDKMLWVNGQHMRRLDPQELSRRVKPFLKSQPENLEAWVELYQTRTETLKDLAVQIQALQSPAPMNLVDWPSSPDSAKLWAAGLKEVLEDTSSWDEANIAQVLRGYAQSVGLSFKELALWARFILIRKPSSPDLSKLLFVLGKEEVVRRFQSFLAL